MFAFETGKYEMHTLPGPSDAYSGRKLSSVNCIQWRQSVQFSEKGECCPQGGSGKVVVGRGSPRPASTSFAASNGQ